MAHLNFIDVSQWQGNIDWSAVRNAGYVGAVIKISGSDAGDYYDSKATQNYYGAKNAGLVIGGYHFAGGGDPTHEAEFFVNGMKPFEEGDVFVLDWEIQHPDPVAWCNRFVDRVHELTGVWCLVYMNGSTRNAFNWDIVAQKCGFWIAWYGRDPEGDLPVPGIYVMHQYTSDGSVPGISGRVDLDAWYSSVDVWKKYGYTAANDPNIQQPTPTPTPVPEPTPEPEPQPEPTPEPTPEPVPEPLPEPTPAPKPVKSHTIVAIIGAAIGAALTWLLAHWPF